MGVLLTILYYRVDDGVSRTDMARIFISLGGDNGGGRGEVLVGGGGGEGVGTISSKQLRQWQG